MCVITNENLVLSNHGIQKKKKVIYGVSPFS